MIKFKWPWVSRKELYEVVRRMQTDFRDLCEQFQITDRDVENLYERVKCLEEGLRRRVTKGTKVKSKVTKRK